MRIYFREWSWPLNAVNTSPCSNCQLLRDAVQAGGDVLILHALDGQSSAQGIREFLEVFASLASPKLRVPASLRTDSLWHHVYPNCFLLFLQKSQLVLLPGTCELGRYCSWLERSVCVRARVRVWERGNLNPQLLASRHACSLPLLSSLHLTTPRLSRKPQTLPSPIKSHWSLFRFFGTGW